MSRRSEDATSVEPDGPDGEAVSAYLRRHPDFLIDHPQLMATLTPPEMQRGERVLDMQKFMLDSLRAEFTSSAAREAKLMIAAEAALSGQARVQRAVLALLAARSFEDLIRILNDEAPETLGIRAVVLCVETGKTLPRGGRSGVVLVRRGTIERLLGRDRDFVLRDERLADDVVFGAASGDIRSHALLRLDYGRDTPAGLLALGSIEPDGFHRGQGSDLLAFFGRVLEHCIRRWLAHPL